MAQIILDAGSGNSCSNDKTIVKRIYDELKAVDTGKHTVICKWQLFEKAGDNIPLLPEVFDYAYEYGTSLGYEVTASVFDKKSLDFLLQYEVPFVKIANNRALDWLIGEIPRKIPVYVSYGNTHEMRCYKNMYTNKITNILCISKYPATIEDYRKEYDFDFEMRLGCQSISDHTIGLAFFKMLFSYNCKPKIWEMHYCLDDSHGLDAGPFARRPSQLAEVL